MKLRQYLPKGLYVATLCCGIFAGGSALHLQSIEKDVPLSVKHALTLEEKIRTYENLFYEREHNSYHSDALSSQYQDTAAYSHILEREVALLQKTREQYTAYAQLKKEHALFVKNNNLKTTIENYTRKRDLSTLRVLAGSFFTFVFFTLSLMILGGEYLQYKIDQLRAE